MQYRKHCEIQEYWFKCAWCDVQIAAKEVQASKRDHWKRDVGVHICGSCDKAGVTSRASIRACIARVGMRDQNMTQAA